MLTLADAMAANGHSKADISYLKVDVESHEIEAIPEWLETGVLKNIHQIGLEIHTGNQALTEEERPPVLKALLGAFVEFYRLGFRVVSFSPNYCVNRHRHRDRDYYCFANVVFVRV